MNSIKSRLPLAALIVGLAAASLAACGGGGTGNTTTPSAPIVNNGAGSGSTTQSTGAHISFTYTQGVARPGTSTAATRHIAGSRAPKFIDYYAVGGLQLTITSGTATPQVLYYDVTRTNPNCVVTDTTNNSVACTLNIPTLGTTETIAAVEVDHQPTNVSATTGLGTGFPSNSGVIAVGSTSVTLPGGYTNVPLSLNPVVASYYDCGYNTLSGNFGEDYSNSSNTQAPRIVVTAGTPATAYLYPTDVTVDGDIPAPVSTPAAGFVGQPFVDVNGTATALTATSSSSHVSFFVEPGAATTPAPTYTTSASIPNSSVNYENNNYYSMIFLVQYDGVGTSPMTLTFANNLSATPPAFGGGTPSPAYTFTYTYPIVPVSLTPATLTFASSGALAQTVTASDSGSTQNMTAPASCISSGSVTIASVTSLAPLANGLQSFTIAPVATGTCTFSVKDGQSNVPTNTVTVTVN